MRIRFKMLPIPKSLNRRNIVVQIEIKKPRLELPNRSENTKKRNTKRFTKNRSTNSDDLGSVK